MINVSKAVVGDGADLWRTTHALAENHGTLKYLVATAADYDAAFGKSEPLISAFIATVDGGLAGTAVMHRSYSTFAGRETMFLEDLSVLPEFRRQGVASALMKAVAAEALNRGCPKISWWMMDWNEAGRSLYEGLGAVVDTEHRLCTLSGDALKELAV
jgi:GNAT superfamily N-acetyltransferase